MVKYEEVISEISGRKIIMRTDEDGTIWSIPNDPANSDYQAYLKYLEEINAN